MDRYEKLMKELEEYEKEEDTTKIGQTLFYIGIHLVAEKKFKLALQYFENALDVLKEPPIREDKKLPSLIEREEKQRQERKRRIIENIELAFYGLLVLVSIAFLVPNNLYGVITAYNSILDTSITNPIALILIILVVISCIMVVECIKSIINLIRDTKTIEHDKKWSEKMISPRTDLYDIVDDRFAVEIFNLYNVFSVNLSVYLSYMAQLMYPIIIYFISDENIYSFGLLNGNLLSKVVIWGLVGVMIAGMISQFIVLQIRNRRRNEVLTTLEENIRKNRYRTFSYQAYLALKQHKQCKIGILAKLMDGLIIFLTLVSVYVI